MSFLRKSTFSPLPFSGPPPSPLPPLRFHPISASATPQTATVPAIRLAAFDRSAAAKPVVVSCAEGVKDEAEEVSEIDWCWWW